MVRRDSIWKSLDWVTIIIYLMLIVFGWFSICGASYDYGDRDFLDFSTVPASSSCGLSAHSGWDLFC